MLVKDARISGPLDVIQTRRTVKVDVLNPTPSATRLVVGKNGADNLFSKVRR